ncbi:sigma-54-dependent transcriptional regulator [Chitinophaga barathri]|uniref:Sigma-54-dependent Fis family transcriptional regulator n=1 Tax=Chitinophaga barathri TaxID=1647451 RepID=A0A3N4M556_9BACT|nr:sigma-54 dependent transcriptional regulator [Chitinophaga barathri]RPD38331.1 sigma-54-dependent Fis family transcriptional regulator [Chitinophaga barathri]
MKPKILIVEDQFIEAKSLNVILTNAGYSTCTIARSVAVALSVIEREKPDLVLVDIFLQGEGTGIDLGKILHEKNMAFVYLSANSNRQILDAAKSTKPYGFMVKPFRAKDVLIMLDVALYLHQNRQPAIDAGSSAKKKPPTALPPELSQLIGSSPKFNEVLEQVKMVGPIDTSVLILGESGTGKEMIAHSIHKLSARRFKPFVVVNCGTLPANLIESELFGHEKGTFTGALAKRIGKFELADGGTIFLDEIGELPLELQVKFLRVLQEREIEPLGGKPRKINVRLLAATNKDLEEEVAAGRFRIDLYYRLNVFPMRLPALRDRKSDIPLLADFFIKKYSEEKKPVPTLSRKATETLMAYDWPGNIRELENTIQRNIVMTSGAVIDQLEIPTSRLSITLPSTDKDRFKTMIENERDHIISVLESCNWKISGKGGAAEILDINVNTLNSRIRKLGIQKEIIARKS